MNTQSKNGDSGRLFDTARALAADVEPNGTRRIKAELNMLKDAMENIDYAYSLVESRFLSLTRIPSACEWLLDNRYLALREGKNAYSELYALGRLGDSKGGLILFKICNAYLNETGDTVSEAGCRAFLNGFQSACVLPRKELYAFPSALKAALIIRLSKLCLKLTGSSEPEKLEEGFAAIFTSLRFLGTADLKQMLIDADVCETELMSDPTGVYPLMDEQSRGYYRERLSELAQKKGIEEHKLAKHIIRLCERSEGDARHPGFHLFAVPDEREEKHKGAWYIAANVLITLFLSLLCGFLSKSLLTALLLILPLSELTKALLDYIILLSVKPRRLPRLELKDGIPDSARTLCVISALLTEPDAAKKCAERLEETYLCNRSCGKNLSLGILADLRESDTPESKADRELISLAASEIDRLNEKYKGGFFLFTRPRRLDESSKKYMGFERKRGAVLALSALLLGKPTELKVTAGEAEGLKGTKYIISLDSDTRPSPDSLRELVGAILHPLNKPKLDRTRGIVTAGHGIIHPKMSYELSSVSATDFSRIFAGSGGLEPYSALCGEVYTDLFDRGGFSGKGIIDAEALFVCSSAHIPDGLVLSHDALEGAFLRGSYMSDCEFSDSHPSSPVAYYRRSHRWIRGDWQNSAWMFERSLPAIERFRLFDSLRRSMVPPMTFLAIFLGLLIPGIRIRAAVLAALLALGTELVISLANLCTGTRDDIKVRYFGRMFSGVGAAFIRWLMRLWLLPYEAWICASAAVTSVYRMLISGEKLLEWETAAQSEAKSRNIGGYYRHMWFAPAAGIFLCAFSAYISAKTVGLLWIVAPIAALSLSFPAKRRPSMSKSDREYLLRSAGDIWSYFEKFCSAEDNFLPPDNFQEQPPVGIAHRSSPTNLGLALVSALCAEKLGLGDGIALIEKMLPGIEALPRYRGHFYNWYDTRTLRCLEPKYVSTVDCGNMFACLTVVKNGLIELGKSELAERIDKLLRPMDFSCFYDNNPGLLTIGIEPGTGKKTPACYDLMASEARLTSFIAVAKGDVPRTHWRRLSRAMRSCGGYRGMASWTGTMFEYLMPELFLPLCPDSLLGETAKYCMYVQKHRRSESGLWGISESAFFSLDPSLNYRYKAHGCAHLALKRGQDVELVISPYSSFLALCVEPKAAIANLRRLEQNGAVGKYGFIEAIDFTPSRIRNDGGEAVRCFMVHHLGMSLAAVTNCLLDFEIVRLFMQEPSMRAYRSLLEERMPSGSDVLKLSEASAKPAQRPEFRQWSKCGGGIDFAKPQCAVLSNGKYNIMSTESGIALSMCGDVLIARSPLLPLGEGHGTEIRLYCGGERFSLLPEPCCGERFSWKFGEISHSISQSGDLFDSKVERSAAGAENGELYYIELSAKSELKEAELCFSFEPVLARVYDYVNHPAYWRLGIESHTDGDCLMLRRLRRGELGELFLCLACDRKLAYSSGLFTENGFLSYPKVTATLGVNIPAGESASMRIALCVGASPDEAYSGAQHILTSGPAQFGAMVSACALLMDMESRQLDSAMELIRPLWFTGQTRGSVAKHELWQYGISGDIPIILCPEGERSGSELSSLVKEFCLLRICGVEADLAILADEEGEYIKPVYSCVRDTLALNGLEPLLGVHGGIRILPPAAGDILESAAAVITGSPPNPRNTEAGYLIPERSQRRAGYVPRHSYEQDGSFMFYADKALPPKIWSNIITNGELGYLAADSGCGNMWLHNAREFRINRWLNDPVATVGPETLEYICDRGRYSVFAAADGIPCRVKFGFGCAVWEKSFGNAGLRCTAFIPDGVNVRVFIIESCGSISGQLAWKTELLLSDSEDNYSSVELSFDDGVFKARNRCSAFPDTVFKAAGSSMPLVWTGDLFSWYRGDYDGKLYDVSVPIFGLVYALKPVTVITCGECSDEELKRLSDPENALNELHKVKELWRQRVCTVSISGDLPFGHYLNGWASYQTLACRIMGRCSVYQSGGAVGFRDQLQDAVNLLLYGRRYARDQILECCAHQYLEGDVMHWWHQLPDGDRGVRTHCSDDMLWLAWALCEYVEKTGDTELASVKVPYLSSEPLSEGERDRYETAVISKESGTVLDHAKRAIERCRSRGVGGHGLLHFGSGDWNDGMDNIGGESVWLSWFFAHTVRRFSDLLLQLGENGSEQLRVISADIGKAAENAWDGAWYLRGYWKDGTPLGSKNSDCCRIDSIAQSFSVLCVEASNSRSDMAIDSAVSELYDRENGIVRLFTPPFYNSRLDPGYISSYGPGFRENGGQYTHAAIWLAIACIRRGRVNDAYSILCDLLPDDKRQRDYMAEPFVIAADVYSCPGHIGEAGWTWYTGSSGWYLRAVLEELIGLRLWAGYLYIRPNLPDGFPGCELEFTANNGQHHTLSISTEGISLDGERYDGKGIPYF